jgi:ATP-dependent protease HslVU (ClpYQ) ATPase subunit
MNFEQSFIDKVAEELGNLNKTQNNVSGRSLNPDIQGKLDKLKMKLEGINNEHVNSLSQKQMDKIDKITMERGNYA